MTRTEELVALINKHRFYYYCVGKPAISDREYDKFEIELREIEGDDFVDELGTGSSNDSDYPLRGEYIKELIANEPSIEKYLREINIF